jgi:hypothetical protein
MVEQADRAPDRPSPRLRWFQFRLRTLFVVMTLWALWLGWICDRAHRQRDAVAAIEAAGGGVKYDDADPSDPFSGVMRDWSTWQWPGKAVLRRWLGRDYLDNLVVVWLSAEHVDEALMMRLTRVPSLRRLDIRGPGARNRTWAHLGSFGSLEELHLADTGIADGDLIHVSSIRFLRYLDLGGTKITDAALPCLARLSSLRDLDLRSTKITDAGLLSVGRLDSLDSLNLSGTKVTAAGLEHLKGLRSLRRLGLYGIHTTREEAGKLKKVFPNADLYGREVK